MRIYDGRIGKFLSVDPITKKYPMLTPYQFASNRPIDGIDLDGLEYAEYARPNENAFFYKLDQMEKDPKHWQENVAAQNKKAFITVSAWLTAGSGTAFTIFTDLLILYGANEVRIGAVHKDATQVKEGMSDMTAGMLGDIGGKIIGKALGYIANKLKAVKQGFNELGYTYKNEITKSINGDVDIQHYLIKGEEKLHVGMSSISKNGELTNIFDVPEGLQNKGVSKAMYTALQETGFSKVVSSYGNGSADLRANYDAFMKVYDAAKGNAVEAAYGTPAAKALGKGWTPTNIKVTENKVTMEWVKSGN